jgi:hypothetical protein
MPQDPSTPQEGAEEGARDTQRIAASSGQQNTGRGHAVRAFNVFAVSLYAFAPLREIFFSAVQAIVFTPYRPLVPVVY